MRPLSEVQTCIGCGKNAPETETNYTLISAQFGWRLTRVKKADGTVSLEWRCPTCWREYKKTRAPGANDAGDMPHESPSSGVSARSEGAIRTRPASSSPEPDESAPGAPPRRPGRSSR